MSKTYFCELISVFLLNLDQNIAVIIYGLSRSIIIEKKLHFVLWFAITRSFIKEVCQICPKAYKTWTKIQNFTKLGENMFQMTFNKHSKFHGDQIIGGAIIVKKASKQSISKVNNIKLQQHFHNIHLYSYHMIDFLILIDFAPRISCQSNLRLFKKTNYFCELALCF